MPRACRRARCRSRLPQHAAQLRRVPPVSIAAAPADLVPELLQEYGAQVRERIDAYLAPREPRRFLYEIVADYPRRRGRMLRSSLCLAAARAFGASADDA